VSKKAMKKKLEQDSIVNLTQHQQQSPKQRPKPIARLIREEEREKVVKEGELMKLRCGYVP
jgi:hypothetical protein